MSKRRRNELTRLYSGKTEEDLRSIYNHAVKLRTKTAAEHAEVIEELLDPMM